MLGARGDGTLFNVATVRPASPSSPRRLARRAASGSAVIVVAIAAAYSAEVLEQRVMAMAEYGAAQAGRWLRPTRATMVEIEPVTPLAGKEPQTHADPVEEAASYAPVQKKQASRRASLAPVPDPVPKGVLLRAERVLQLAEKRVRPSATSVAATGARPPGLALTGVEQLGIGLREGDVLTHVGGQPVSSVGHVIGSILEMRGREVSSISGTVWRGRHSFPITVEQPYLVPKQNRR